MNYRKLDIYHFNLSNFRSNLSVHIADNHPLQTQLLSIAYSGQNCHASARPENRSVHKNTPQAGITKKAV
ncbi:hypothetical protein ECZC01_25050 [Escherichia coli]|nr:hypothetical protein TUM13867_11560 [Escherichia coli]BDG98045.1 hypothetical protein TUM20902_11590 [Escherichia coli]BEA83618.1 hypothetical protein VEE04_33750 [Escherichia coli]GHK37915.1 hypothetical protein ECZU06_50400 [Escherichia coli]GHK68723.1 hypothetical protein ECZU12_01340 [Escherichia coli]